MHNFITSRDYIASAFLGMKSTKKNGFMFTLIQFISSHMLTIFIKIYTFVKSCTIHANIFIRLNELYFLKKISEFTIASCVPERPGNANSHLSVHGTFNGKSSRNGNSTHLKDINPVTCWTLWTALAARAPSSLDGHRDTHIIIHLLMMDSVSIENYKRKKI